jgi:hypothetical protein
MFAGAVGAEMKLGGRCPASKFVLAEMFGLLWNEPCICSADKQ